MIKQIVKDEDFLARKSEQATNRDRQIITDLKDTLKANSAACVGMAANMIGELKRIIIYTSAKGDVVMVNPRIISKQMPYDTEEGCLSLQGVRPVKRWQVITVEYLDDHSTQELKIVTTVRANSLGGYITPESPVGKALIGHKVGDTVHVKVNDAVQYDLKIVSLENTDDSGDEINSY